MTGKQPLAALSRAVASPPNRWGRSDRPESATCSRFASRLNLCQHLVDISRGVVQSRRRANDRQLLPYFAQGLTTMCLDECLSDPFGHRHLMSARGAPDLTIFGVLEDDLHSFRHVQSISRNSVAGKSSIEGCALPVQPQRELDLAGVFRGADVSKVRSSVDEPGPVEVRMVGQIEEIGSKHYPKPLIPSHLPF